MPDPRPLFPADPRLLGDYELLGRLGSGGQGTVYLGRRTTGGPGGSPQVAIKLLHPQLLGDSNARARFVRELAVLTKVAGFCTAQMLAADMAGDRPYIVSEFVPGPSLQQQVRQDGPRVGADLDRLAISTVTALTAIHRVGVVHRDFKPQNVLIGPDGPRVIDFGIARALDAGATVTSQIVGTPAYMAPEQFDGAGVGPAADMFAWAGTVIFAATGAEPFGSGALPAVMYQVLNGQPDLSSLPPLIADVLRDCLAKDPARRPSAEEALLRLLGQSAAPAVQPIPSEAATTPDAVNTPPNPETLLYPGGAPPADPTRQQYAGQGQQGTLPYADQGLGGQGRPGALPHADQGPYVPAGQQGVPPHADLGPYVPAGQQGVPPYADQGAGGPYGGGVYGVPGGQAYGGPPYDPYQQEARPARSRLRLGPLVITGLILAVLLAAFDLVGYVSFLTSPSTQRAISNGTVAAATAVFGLPAVIVLLAVLVAFLGRRWAAWAVLAVLALREPLWLLWRQVAADSNIDTSPGAYIFHVGLALIVGLLLITGLQRRDPPRS